MSAAFHLIKDLLFQFTRTQETITALIGSSLTQREGTTRTHIHRQRQVDRETKTTDSEGEGGPALASMPNGPMISIN